MSNVLKSGFVTFQEDKKWVIDSNELVAKRLGNLISRSTDILGESDGGGADAADGGMDAAVEEALFGDGSGAADGIASKANGSHPGAAGAEKPAYSGPSPEELLEDAKKEIEEMKASAVQEIEQMRQQTVSEAKQQGYNDGYGEGKAKAGKEAAAAAKETENLRKKLREEYENSLQELEPLVINELTDIYDHVFAAGLKENKEIIFHLLDTTLHHIDSGKEFILRVSQEDYEYISSRKEEFLERMGNITLDVVEDPVLKQGDGMIETGGGLFDCSIDVELKELKERIRTLAYQK